MTSMIPSEDVDSAVTEQVGQSSLQRLVDEEGQQQEAQEEEKT